jgi:hypothetical protein
MPVINNVEVEVPRRTSSHCIDFTKDGAGETLIVDQLLDTTHLCICVYINGVELRMTTAQLDKLRRGLRSEIERTLDNLRESIERETRIKILGEQHGGQVSEPVRNGRQQAGGSSSQRSAEAERFDPSSS